MVNTSKRGSFGTELEQALRGFERALDEAAPTGRRHARPEDDETEELRDQRMTVIRHAEALPRALWPRPVCEHCAGQRQIEAVHVQHAQERGSPVGAGQRMCPRCRGTGLTLNTDAIETKSTT
ncbi:hypothetical protein [Bounagaea algeriensis]